MFDTTFKIAFRNLWRNKGLNALNIAGLAVGVTCAIFIFLWAEDEVTYDASHGKKEVLYQVYQNQASEGNIFTINATPGPLADGLKKELPGVKNACRTTWKQRLLFSPGEKKIKEEGLYADSSIFSLFTLPFVEGTPHNAFAGNLSLVITQRMANRFFGHETNLIGKVLKADTLHFVITGVLKDLPANSTLQFDWLAPFGLHFQYNQWLQHWQYNGVQTFVEVEPTADVAAINKKLAGYTAQKTTKRAGQPFLLSMKDWRLRSNFEDGMQKGGRIQYVKMFILIAVIILLIACINFMNLATAQSAGRAKEVGVRKVMGAEKSSLIRQFISEAVLQSLIAVLLAVVFVQLLLPLFNALVQKDLALHFDKPEHLFSLLAISLVCGIIAGGYPSFYLSSFQPVAVLKGFVSKDGGAAFIRRGLVVLQFAVSVIFIISTLVIYQQIQHVKNRPLGYNKDNLLQLELTDPMQKHFGAIKQDLLTTGTVDQVAASMLDVLYMGSTTADFSWAGKDPNNQVILTQNWVSPDYIPAIGMKMLQGRDFHPGSTVDSAGVIVNETLARLIDSKNAVGKTVTRGHRTFTVIGVTADVVYGDMYSSGTPMIFLSYPEIYHYLYLRLTPGKTNQSLAQIDAVLKKYDPDYAADFAFVDREFNKLFEEEMLTGKLSRLFAFLAIIISCLGLFGLAAYTAEMRTKEIGIRKVLGAEVSSIVALLSKEFLKLVLLASFIAMPAGWWIMNKWLEDYAYRVSINWNVFLLAGLSAVFVALVTISFQAIKAATTNPVKNLRNE